MRHAIAQPLGMTSSEIPADLRQARRDLRKRLATGYCAFRSAYVRSPLIHNHCHPAAGLLTTASDQLRLLEALAAGGERDGVRILSAASVALMLTPQASFANDEVGDGWNVGIGAMLLRERERTVWFGHSGMHVWGWTTESRVYPALGLSIVVCCNAVELAAWHDGALSHPATFVCDVASGFLTARHRPHGWAWHVSHLAGLLLVERLRLLGLDVLGPATTGALLERTAPAGRTGCDWDAAGFRAGVREAAAVGTTSAELHRFFDEQGPTPELLAAAWQLLGGRYPGLPVELWEPEARSA